MFGPGARVRWAVLVGLVGVVGCEGCQDPEGSADDEIAVADAPIPGAAEATAAGTGAAQVVDLPCPLVTGSGRQKTFSIPIAGGNNVVSFDEPGPAHHVIVGYSGQTRQVTMHELPGAGRRVRITVAQGFPGADHWGRLVLDARNCNPGPRRVAKIREDGSVAPDPPGGADPDSAWAELYGNSTYVLAAGDRVDFISPLPSPDTGRAGETR